MSDWKRIPDRYRDPLPPEKSGTLLPFEYLDGTTPRRALVYLPRGYEDCLRERRERRERYPVLFLMHGGGGNEEEFFGGTGAKTPLKSMLDRMIDEGAVRPLIVVTPTFNRPADEGADPDAVRVHARDAAALTAVFWRELEESLIPAADAAFRTEGTRDSRAFGGFSMGAEATWSVLCRGGSCVRYYLPMSGDFWAAGVKGGKDHTVETCDRLIEGIRARGLAPEDYRVFAVTGEQDIACEAMQPMVEELMGREPWFRNAEEGGNLTWRLSPGWHAYEWCWDYIAMALPEFFPAEKG